MSRRSSLIRKSLVTGAVVAGAGIGAAGIASAATGTTSTSNPASSAGSSPSAPRSSSSAPLAAGPNGAPPAGAQGNPAAMTHGPNETLLTGTDLQKADASANAAVPGATVIRAETDSSGASPYEVHMKKADGTYVTVELNSNFAPIKTISGFGAGPAGGAPPGGSTTPPAAA
jgi:hypothetical protein